MSPPRRWWGGTHPVVLFAVLLLACHGLAFMALQLAFQRGPALATAGLSALLTNALPVLAGLVIYAEAMPGGAAGALRAAGFAGTVSGAALLAARSDHGRADKTRTAAARSARTKGRRHRLALGARQPEARYSGMKSALPERARP
jgi:hypothetical protein